MDVLIGTGIGLIIGLTAGLPLGLWIRRDQIRAAREGRYWAGWRAVCAQAAANRLGWPERHP